MVHHRRGKEAVQAIGILGSFAMRPQPPLSIMCGIAALAVCQAPVRFVSITLVQSFSWI
jgi:hypothetical protein